MRPDRKLQLRREALADLSSDELAMIGAGSPDDATRGRVCGGIAIATIVIIAVSTITTTRTSEADA